jgi:hypothetical protein
MRSLRSPLPQYGARARRWIGACALAVVVTLGGVADSDAGPSGYWLIVRPDNPNATIDRSFVGQAFLRKVRRWPGGETILPVDLDRHSAVRTRWSQEVLGRSVEAVKAYWQQMIFSGRGVPPPEVPSDADVVDYVLRTPGGVGYVTSGTNLRGAKILEIR